MRDRSKVTLSGRGQEILYEGFIKESQSEKGFHLRGLLI